MQIRFTNYKKIYLSLGILVFLLGSLYLLSVVVNRNRNKVNKLSQNTKVTTTQNKNGVSVVTSETETELVKLLSNKTELLVNSIVKSSVDYLEDPVFEDAGKDLLGKVIVEIRPYANPVKITIKKVLINSDGRSGRVYVTISESSGKTSGIFEFVFSQNVKNKWKFVDFSVSKSVHLEGESSEN